MSLVVVVVAAAAAAVVAAAAAAVVVVVEAGARGSGGIPKGLDKEPGQKNLSQGRLRDEPLMTFESEA